MIVRVLGAFAIGALAVYFFDPVSGKRRRALLRDQMVHAQREIGDYAEGTAKDLRNRAQGLVADARGMVERRLGQRRQASAVDIDLSQ
jgi:gas vesicle protein